MFTVRENEFAYFDLLKDGNPTGLASTHPDLLENVKELLETGDVFLIEG